MWVRIDTAFGRHPKLLALTPADRWVHVAAMCWVAENATDGAIPKAAIDHIAPGAKAAAKRLVAVGLWDVSGDGWAIHDWLAYNISAEDAQRQTQAKRERQRQWHAKRKAARDAEFDASNGASKDASFDASPRGRARARRPDPTPSFQEGRGGDAHTQTREAATPAPAPGAQSPPREGQDTERQPRRRPSPPIADSELVPLHVLLQRDPPACMVPVLPLRNAPELTA